ncbi:MAG TPA: hypothetical protein VK892_08750 [Pyrinomonadaceae bacterium]|nr:hypothetical protein [Pyrinomonadaceae bacterium]
MDIEYIKIITTALNSSAFAGVSVAIYKIIIAYFQKDKDKSVSIIITEDNKIEIKYNGYPMSEVKALTDEKSIKNILK